MSQSINDFTLQISTINGSGSQSANALLVKALFRMGLAVSGQNLFPSNIAGLPTWFNIRVNKKGFCARKTPFDLVVSLNESTLAQDIKAVKPNGFYFYNSEFKISPEALRNDVQCVAIPFRDLCGDISESPKLKKLLYNLIYVGVLSEILKIEGVLPLIAESFKQKTIAANEQAYLKGVEFAKTLTCPFRVESQPDQNKQNILIDGNMAAGLGSIMGGCTVVAWYPITPSSSVIESFEELAKVYRKGSYAVLQAEDELASISMVIGAGWAGARAMTATSGPGLSLMAEAAGLSYYAEIPAVIWDVQRVGPSTGLPTRTMQGDVLSAANLSHGDTEHLVLIPANPEECFEFAQNAFDLAERFQTLVIVLSDLDLGMNQHVTKRFDYPDKKFDRGKVLSIEDLNAIKKFSRYEGDSQGIAPRTLPGTQHPLAAYFTRGTGHNKDAAYSEKAEDYVQNMDRLKLKIRSATNVLPQPVIEVQSHAIGLIAYGSTDFAIAEISELLVSHNINTDYLRIRSLPFSDSVEDFGLNHQKIYVLEQNRDGQMLTLLRSRFPQIAHKLISVLQYDGLPAEPAHFVAQILKNEMMANE